MLNVRNYQVDLNLTIKKAGSGSTKEYNNFTELSAMMALYGITVSSLSFRPSPSLDLLIRSNEYPKLAQAAQKSIITSRQP